jgi:hypothetical protein
VTALTAGVALPGAALAQQPSNPFSPGVPQQAPTAATTATPTIVPPTTTASSNNSGLNGAGALAIGIGAIVVLGGISLFIWRDARRRAPVRHHAATAPSGPGSKRKVKPRKLSPAERRRRKRGRAR